MSNQVLNLNPKLAEKAKAADDAALEVFHNKAAKLSRFFSIKETARLMRVSTGYLRTHSEKHGITFADRDNRSRLRKRRIKKVWDYYMIHFDLRRVVKPVPPVQLGEIKINPGLELQSRNAWFSRRNVFFERCCELAELFTILEASQILGVSHRFLLNFAYNEQITFVGEPSLDVKNDFYFRAEGLAKDSTPIAVAAKALAVTPRFLVGYAKNWDLPFELPETSAVATSGEEVDSGAEASFMEDLCIDPDAIDDEADLVASAEDLTFTPTYCERAPSKTACGASYANF